MNWNKLQEMQLELDNAILQAKPKMSAEERFNKTLVALSAEVAEVSNCSEHFKFWKDNKGKVDEDRFGKQEMYVDDELVDVNYIEHKTGITYTFEKAHKLTLVEETSDCLHFILSLANQLDTEIGGFNLVDTNSNLEIAYSMIQLNISCMNTLDSSNSHVETLGIIIDWFYYYISKLGITTQELEQAYYEKNKVNYERLREGY